MTMETPLPPTSDVPGEFVDDYRVITVTQGHADGSCSVRQWYLETEAAERLVALLGPSQESTFVPPKTVEILAQINDGLPTLGSDFFS